MSEVEKVRSDARKREEALNREIQRLQEERWLAPSNYPPNLKTLERENSQLRVELQLQQQHVLALSNQIIAMQEELKGLRECKAGRDEIAAVGEEMQMTLHGFAQANADLKHTADRIRRDRAEGVYPSHPLMTGGTPPAGPGHYISPPVGVDETLYAGFATTEVAPLRQTEMTQVANDVHTQFRTLAVALLGHENNHASLKEEILHHMLAQPSAYSKHVCRPDTVESIVARHRNAPGWGGAGSLLTLQAAADRFRTRILVHLLPHSVHLDMRPSTQEPLAEAQLALWIEDGHEVYCPVNRKGIHLGIGR